MMRRVKEFVQCYRVVLFGVMGSMKHGGGVVFRWCYGCNVASALESFSVAFGGCVYVLWWFRLKEEEDENIVYQVVF